MVRARETSASPEIDAYIAAAPAPSRERLRALRALVREEAPDAIERMAYAMPTWHQGENLVHLAGYAKHVGLYPGSAAIEAFADELSDYVVTKGTVQLPHAKELPTELVRRIVRSRVAAVTGASASPKRAAVQALRDPGPLSFEATLQRSDASGAACFVMVPWDLRETFGKANLVPVSVLWDGRVAYTGSLAMMGGPRAMLLCRKDVVAALNKSAGDTVSVTVRLDLAPREVEVPEALATALDADSGAKSAWDALSVSCRREYAQWIADAKREETRAARVAKALPMITARKRLKD
jgi:uncharacterized protein YdhG (YjbR/CyaY superfamily)